MTTKNRFVDVAQGLHDNGYNITPLSGKRPLLDDWAAITIDDKKLATWLRKYPKCNVGIQARDTPAIDIDIYDADAAAEMETWCLDNLSGDALVRVGQAPKRLLVFRADEPFKKMKVKFVDGDGVEHAIEILGDGQQFVAFGVHPDTRKPFEWVSIDSPLDVAVDDLPLLTQQDAQRVLDAFTAMAKRRGWTPSRGKSTALATRNTSTGDADDDALLGMVGKATDLDDDDIRDALANVEDVDDYDRWLTVGMALHHQYDGGDAGLDLWREWSEQGINYDADVLDDKWESFSVVRSGGKPTTIATILKWAKDGTKQKTKDEFERVKAQILGCNDPDSLFDDAAAQLSKLTLLPHQFEKAATMLQTRLNEIDQVKMPLAKVRKALLDAMRRGKKIKNTDKVETPEWALEFVWIEGLDCFFSTRDRKTVSTRTFNARYDRYLLTPEDIAAGVAVPATRAADAALSLYTIQHVDGFIYLPGADDIVELGDGDMRVNTYDDRDVPDEEKPRDAGARAALAVVERHFEIMFPDQRERELVLSFLAHQVQGTSQRVNWAVLIQGAEGAGKTWVQNLMAAVLGPRNVKPVKPSSLFSDFNGWAEGSQMSFVEEIRLRGHDRYEVLDKIKDVLTNDTFEMTKKGQDPISAINTASYMLFTNWQDALTLSDNDRRYLITQSAIQNKRQIEALLAEHPDYFDRLFAAVVEYPGVMRWWLSTMSLHPEFDPKGRAPMTRAKQLMAEINKSDEQDALFDLIDAGQYVDCSGYLVNVTTLPDRLQEFGAPFPKTTAIKVMMEQAGFTFLGRHKIDGVLARYYTSRPDLFPNREGSAVAERIRRILDGEEPELL